MTSSRGRRSHATGFEEGCRLHIVSGSRENHTHSTSRLPLDPHRGRRGVEHEKRGEGDEGCGELHGVNLVSLKKREES